MAPFSLSCHFTGKENYDVQMDGFLRIENPKLRFIPIAVKNWTRMGFKKKEVKMAATNELGRLKLTFRGFQKSSHRPVDMNEFLDEHLMNHSMVT